MRCPNRCGGEFVSGNYFSTLGLGAYAGRVFSDSDDTPASQPTTVLSYQAWQGEYAADPSIVGSTILFRRGPSPSSASRPLDFLGTARIGFSARFLDAASDGTLCPGSKRHPPSSGVQLALPVRQSARRHKHRRIAGEAYRCVAASGSIPARCLPLMVARASFPRQHVTITPGGGGIQKLATGNGQGSQNADDPLLRRVAHRLR